MKRQGYYPFCVQIELVQGCNRDCEFCGTRGIEKTIHTAKIETIYKAAELLKKYEYDGRILLAGHGEPTLHPKLIECINVLRQMLPKAHITMFTNGYGILKRPKLLDETFMAGLDAVMFDEYEDNRIKGAVFAIAQNGKYCIEELTTGVQIFNRSEKRKRIIIAPPIGEDAKAMNRKLCNHCGAGMPKTEKPQDKVCSIIFRDFFIRHDGWVAICCNDFRGEYPVVNIMDCRKFEDAYFHPRLEAARKRIMQKDRRFHPCAVCDVTPLRAGLLPDKTGKMKMPQPTPEDYRITEEKHKPLAQIRKREWEK